METIDKTLSVAVAKEILGDLQGAAYYRDSAILTDFLKSKFASATNEATSETARAILDDLHGAAYYTDPDILADFLRSQLARG